MIRNVTQIFQIKKNTSNTNNTNDILALSWKPFHSFVFPWKMYAGTSNSLWSRFEIMNRIEFRGCTRKKPNTRPRRASFLEEASFVPIDMRRAYNKLFVQTTIHPTRRNVAADRGNDFHFTFHDPFPRIFVATRTRRVKEARMFSHPRANKGADWNVFALELSDRWRGIGTCQVPHSYVVPTSKRVSKEEGCSCIHGITLSFLIFLISLLFCRKRYNEELKEGF